MISTRKNILALALYAGEIMLKNGAETYRVEDTITRICNAYDVDTVESFVTPTGMFVSLDPLNTENDVTAYIKRIKHRTIDLNKVSCVNNFSRNLSSKPMSLDEGMDALQRIDCLPKYNQYVKALCAGITSAFLGVLLGSTLHDFISSFIISVFVYFSVSFIENLNSNLFIQNVMGGAVASFFAIVSVSINLGINLDKIIISSIMILLPGVAITNAVRDTISGDLLSGLARTTEAILIAISIAVGVGTIMNIWIHLFGGVI